MRQQALADESNLNLLSAGDLLALCPPSTTWQFRIGRVRLLGWTSNLLLFGTSRLHRMERPGATGKPGEIAT
jgi:hypothetical protein